MSPRFHARRPERPSSRAARAALALTSAALLAAAPWPAPRRVAAQDGGGLLDNIRIGLPNYIQGGDIARPRVMYRDSLVSLNDLCAVRHARLDPERDPVYVNGLPIGFCCTPCPAIFSMNPERYLLDLKLTFQDPVTPARKAIIDSSRRIKIGQDIYFFSSVATMRRFRREPLRYCGKLTDPVSHARFRPAPASPHVLFRDRDYWFAADSTKAAFQTSPDRYFERQTGT